ncbi:hypothetical protein M407DRAFT_109274 [Tulasnella calospora MUT 4182]|uniref:Uncharacterized protein n=1 Tax=Tulasnella calospora MUT 4182 TaxID=1051891 RepID=A0A0C3Q3V5_9AGAM|nr:hypothetical protein M407DRAFT_109274 [Tulasnella calospora MUT 4182]
MPSTRRRLTRMSSTWMESLQTWTPPRTQVRLYSPLAPLPQRGHRLQPLRSAKGGHPSSRTSVEPDSFRGTKRRTRAGSAAARLSGLREELPWLSKRTANSLNLDLDETKLKLAINSTPEAHVLDKWIYWANRKPGIEVTIQLKNLTEMRVLTEIIAGMDLAKGKGDDVERSISLTIAGRGSDPPPETTGETPMDPEAQTPFPCEALGYLPLIKEIRCSNHFNATPMLRYLGRPQTNFDDTAKWPCPKLSKLEVNPWESSADTMFEELKAFGEARVGASRAGDPPPATSDVTAAESDRNPESGTVENGGISTTSPAGADATATVASNDSSSGSGSSSDDTISGEPAAAASAVASAVPKQADTEASAAQPDDTSGADDTSSKVAAASVAETVIDEVGWVCQVKW